MRLKKGLSRLTNFKVAVKNFLVTLKQIRQGYSSCATDYQHDFGKRKHLKNTLKKFELSFSFYDYDVINDFSPKFSALKPILHRAWGVKFHFKCLSDIRRCCSTKHLPVATFP